MKFNGKWQDLFDGELLKTYCTDVGSSVVARRWCTIAAGFHCWQRRTMLSTPANHERLQHTDTNIHTDTGGGVVYRLRYS